MAFVSPRKNIELLSSHTLPCIYAEAFSVTLTLSTAFNAMTPLPFCLVNLIALPPRAVVFDFLLCFWFLLALLECKFHLGGFFLS